MKFTWITFRNTRLVKGLRYYVCGKMLPKREIQEQKLIKFVLSRFLIFDHKVKSDSFLMQMTDSEHVH